MVNVSVNETVSCCRVTPGVAFTVPVKLAMFGSGPERDQLTEPSTPSELRTAEKSSERFPVSPVSNSKEISWLLSEEETLGVFALPRDVELLREEKVTVKASGMELSKLILDAAEVTNPPALERSLVSMRALELLSVGSKLDVETTVVARPELAMTAPWLSATGIRGKRSPRGPGKEIFIRGVAQANLFPHEIQMKFDRKSLSHEAICFRKVDGLDLLNDRSS